jgi:hypothetical protein
MVFEQNTKCNIIYSFHDYLISFYYDSELKCMYYFLNLFFFEPQRSKYQSLFLWFAKTLYYLFKHNLKLDHVGYQCERILL